MSDSSMDRRDFVKLGGAAALLGASGGAPGPVRTAMAGARQTRATNLIFMVSDGIGIGGMTLGDLFAQRHLGGGSRWFDWIRSGAPTSLLLTEPAEGLVPDSAAAASAWSVGERVRNGAISITPDEREPTPLLVRAKEAGKAVGVVTTYTVTDATPAAFYANAPVRSASEPITSQLLALQPDVLMGGSPGPLLEDALGAWGDISVIRSRNDLRRHDDHTRPLVGLFSEGPMSFEMDKPDDEPTLEDMTRATLEHFARSDRGFVVLIENELTDDASHSNDAAGMVREFHAFDRALAVALDFAEDRSDTLVIATSDHGNANPGLTFGMDQSFDSLEKIKHSQSWMVARWRELPDDRRDVPALIEIMEDTTGFELTDEEKSVVNKWLTRTPVDPFTIRNTGLSPMGSILGNHHGIGFHSGVHTSDPVIATAQGPGSDAMPTLGHHVDLHRIVVDALGL